MIEDGLAHLRDQLPWKVRVDPRQKHRGNDGPTLHLVRVHGSADSRGEDLRALCLQRSWTRRRWQPAAAGTEAGTIDSALGGLARHWSWTVRGRLDAASLPVRLRWIVTRAWWRLVSSAGLKPASASAVVARLIGGVLRRRASTLETVESLDP